ncbi:unnamed protein product, partial [Didymodactylos carnosus]
MVICGISVEFSIEWCTTLWKIKFNVLYGIFEETWKHYNIYIGSSDLSFKRNRASENNFEDNIRKVR